MGHQNIWDSCLSTIKRNVEEQAFNTWFEPIIPVRFDKNILTIQVPSQFFYEWLEEHYVHVLRDAIIEQLGKDGKLEYSVVIDKGNSKSEPYTINLPTSKRPERKNIKGWASRPSDKALEEIFAYNFNLNPNYTFETLIEGDCNRLARSAGFAVAQRPGITSFNPLVVYGGVGLGKTHLAQAIGNEILQNISDKEVIYVPEEKSVSASVEE